MRMVQVICCHPETEERFEEGEGEEGREPYVE